MKAHHRRGWKRPRFAHGSSQSVARGEAGRTGKRASQCCPGGGTPTTVNLYPRLTSVIGALQEVLERLQEKRDPVSLILD
ncbi:unnamed protein product [Arctia plantaginis]|uniref:Uncharacterized protein n=1 Tax=Arctia plantaginis TaxID=874455 RepID=A0A8S0ZA74_ARCPL|nr:unnamed protein product [Arctia plantaginis]